MRAFLSARLVLSLALAAVSVHAETPKQLEPPTFLLGQWEAFGGGKPGEGVGSATFAFSLQNRVMIRTSYAEYPATGTTPAPRFRLSYRLGSDGILRGEFAVAPPGAPEAFARYLVWESRKAPVDIKTGRR